MPRIVLRPRGSSAGNEARATSPEHARAGRRCSHTDRGRSDVRSRVSGSRAEIVVLANRCADATQPIAAAAAARGVVDQHRNSAATSNAGVAVSSGSVLMTIDPDTVTNAQSAEIALRM